MNARFLLLVTLTLGCGALGCGGKAIGDDSTATDSGTSSNDGSTASDVVIPPDGNVVVPTDAGPMDYCKAAAARDERCMSGTFSLAECQDQLACFRNALRPEAYTPLLTCFANRPCGTSDDRCVAQEAQKYIEDPAVGAWVRNCNDKRSACTGAFSDDYCGYEFGLFSDTLRANVKKCLDRSCSEVRTCLDTVFAAVGCDN